MNPTADVPLFAAVVASFFVVLGAALALIGSVGLLRLGSFYDRIHAPTLGTTLGTGFVLVASMVMFSALELRPVLHEVIIGIFMVLTTPVTFVLLVRAALHRDAAEGKDPTDRTV
jgi:multicomponent K+:H+ antiporter subunit G